MSCAWGAASREGPAEEQGLGASLKEGCRRRARVSIGVHERPFSPRPPHALSPHIARFCRARDRFPSLAILRDSDVFPSFDLRV